MKILKIVRQLEHKTNKYINDLLIALTAAQLHDDLKIVAQYYQVSVANEAH